MNIGPPKLVKSVRSDGTCHRAGLSLGDQRNTGPTMLIDVSGRNSRTLNEMPWVSVPGADSITLPTSTGRMVKVDMVDPRVEDMIRAKFIPYIDPYGKWMAKLPGRTDQFLTPDGLSDGPGSDGPGSDGPGSDWFMLPDGWWEFAYGMMGDENVKASNRPRQEQGEKTQEELDALAGAGGAGAGGASRRESFSRRLDRALFETGLCCTGGVATGGVATGPVRPGGKRGGRKGGKGGGRKGS